MLFRSRTPDEDRVRERRRSPLATHQCSGRRGVLGLGSPRQHDVRLHGLRAGQAPGFDGPWLGVHVQVAPEFGGLWIDLDLLAVEPASTEGHELYFHIERMFAYRWAVPLPRMGHRMRQGPNRYAASKSCRQLLWDALAQARKYAG